MYLLSDKNRTFYAAASSFPFSFISFSLFCASLSAITTRQGADNGLEKDDDDVEGVKHFLIVKSS